MILVESVSAGASHDVGTKDWAARWKMREGFTFARTSWIADASRISQ